MVHKACEQIFTAIDKEGINSVHDIEFDPTKIDHSSLANLQTGKESFYPDASWPSFDLANEPIGEVLERHFHVGDPLFFPFKEHFVL